MRDRHINMKVMEEGRKEENREIIPEYSAEERETVCKVDVDEPGQSRLTHTVATTLALFLFLCCLHQALQVLLLCLSCLTKCLLLFNSAPGCVIVPGERQEDKS